MRPLVGLPGRLVPSGDSVQWALSEPELFSTSTFLRSHRGSLSWPYRLALGLIEPFAPQGQEAVGVCVSGVGVLGTGAQLCDPVSLYQPVCALGSLGPC